MKMKWIIVFCCLIIVLLGGLMIVKDLYYYQQQESKYLRLLDEAQSLIQQDIQRMKAYQDSIIAYYEEDQVNLLAQVEDYYLSYHSERTTTMQLSAELAREKEKSADLTAAIKEATANSVYRTRPFKDKEELLEYLDGYEPGLRYFSVSYLNGNKQCVAFATHLMLDALAHGFLIDTEIDEDNHHAVGKTIINDQYYFIEPKTKEVFRELGGVRWKVGE